MPQFLEPNANLLWVIGVVSTTLLIGTACRLVLVARADAAERRQKLGSLATWWILFALVVVAAVAAPLGMLLLMGTLSLLGLREYRQLTDSVGDVRIWLAAYLLAIIHYAIAYGGSGASFWIVLPLAGFVVIAIASFAFGNRADLFRYAGRIHLGLLLIVFCLSHVVLLVLRLADRNSVAGGAGWFLYVVLLTEINDIAQALWGRSFGRLPITPAVSPRKTWEGFLAGIATTLVAALFLAPWLTPYFDSPPQSFFRFGKFAPYLVTFMSAITIAVAGFLGDISISAVKRASGAKDSGTMLPGQGGILDRIDSLILSAPAYFYLIWLLYPGGES